MSFFIISYVLYWSLYKASLYFIVCILNRRLFWMMRKFIHCFFVVILNSLIKSYKIKFTILTLWTDDFITKFCYGRKSRILQCFTYSFVYSLIHLFDNLYLSLLVVLCNAYITIAMLMLLLFYWSVVLLHYRSQVYDCILNVDHSSDFIWQHHVYLL